MKIFLTTRIRIRTKYTHSIFCHFIEQFYRKIFKIVHQKIENGPHAFESIDSYKPRDPSSPETSPLFPSRPFLESSPSIKPGNSPASFTPSFVPRLPSILTSSVNNGRQSQICPDPLGGEGLRRCWSTCGSHGAESHDGSGAWLPQTGEMLLEKKVKMLTANSKLVRNRMLSFNSIEVHSDQADTVAPFLY